VSARHSLARVPLGLARTGTTGSHFSGDVFLAFSTATDAHALASTFPTKGSEAADYNTLKFIPWGRIDPLNDATGRQSRTPSSTPSSRAEQPSATTAIAAPAFPSTGSARYSTSIDSPPPTQPAPQPGVVAQKQRTGRLAAGCLLPKLWSAR
jgi:hypothetical protein